jgi:tRNA (guanine-N7-)-methyltransferase
VTTGRVEERGTDERRSSPFSKLFGRRKGRPLSAHRQGLIEALLPRVRPMWPADAKIDLAALFGRYPSRLVLEVGFGGGERLAAQAAAEPASDFIGCEPFLNGVAKLLAEIEARALGNVRVLPDDARPLIEALPDRCLDDVYVLYADPWPKNRHAERRFIGKANLDRLARGMKLRGRLVLATDVPVLADWMREQVQAHPAFELLSEGAAPPVGWIPTRYEQKGIGAGRRPVYFVAGRTDHEGK